MNEEIDIKVKKEVEVVDLEDESSDSATTNLASTVNCNIEIIREPGKGVLLSRVSRRKQILKEKQEELDRELEYERARQKKQKEETAEQRRKRLDKLNEQQRLRRRIAKERLLSSRPAATPATYVTCERTTGDELPETSPPQNQNGTAQNKQKRLDMANERARQKKQNESPEQIRQRVAKRSEQQRVRRRIAKERWLSSRLTETPAMTCEQIREVLERQSEEKLAFVPPCKHLTDDELAEECKKILIEKRDKWGQKVKWDEDPNGKLLMTRKKMESVKTAYKSFLEKKKKEDQMSAEELARKKEAVSFKKLVKSAHMTEEERWRKRMVNYLRRHAWEDSWSEEMREQQRKRQRERKRRQFNNMTEEQRNQLRAYQRKAAKKYHQNEKNKEKFRQYLRRRWANQTPEQRQRQLQRHRINQAKRLLKRKLEALGTAPEEIQKQVDQLESKMKNEPLPPLEQVSTYKPRKKQQGDYEETEIQTPSNKISGRHYQYYPHASISNETLQMKSSSGTSENIESNISVRPPPSPSFILSQSGSISQELTSNVNPEERNTEDYFLPDDIVVVVTPVHSPHPPSPTFDNEEMGSMGQTYLSVPPDEQTADETNAQMPQPSISTLPEYSVLLSAEPSPPPILEYHRNEKKCPHCPSSFSKFSQLRSHVHSSHQEQCWTCPKCSSVLLSTRDLLAHFTSRHAGPEQNVVDQKTRNLPFICMKCPSPISTSQFETADMLLDHVRITHPKAFWPCPQCKLLKYNHASLKIHSKICTKRLNS